MSLKGVQCCGTLLKKRKRFLLYFLNGGRITFHIFLNVNNKFDSPGNLFFELKIRINDRIFNLLVGFNDEKTGRNNLFELSL